MPSNSAPSGEIGLTKARRMPERSSGATRSNVDSQRNFGRYTSIRRSVSAPVQVAKLLADIVYSKFANEPAVWGSSTSIDNVSPRYGNSAARKPSAAG